MLIKSCTRNINNPTVPLSSANILSFIGGSAPSKSGQKVNESTGMTLSPVWQCVNMISGDVAKLPLEVFKRTGPKSREKDKMHPAYRALARQANPYQTSFKVFRRMMYHKLLWQRGYLWIDRSDPRRISLYNLLPDRTYFDCTAKTDSSPFGLYFTYADTKWKPLFPSEVLEFEGVAMDDSDGCKLARKAADAWGVALGTQEFKARFYANGAITGGILEIPPSMTPMAADNLEEGFRKRATGGDNWFKTVILRDGAKFHSTTIDPQKQQLTEATKDAAIDICRWFNIQPSRIGVQGSESYGSKEQDNEGYYDQTLSHHTCAIKTECWHKLLSPQEQENDTHVIEHNTRAIFAMNAKTQAEVGQLENSFGATSINDYLAATNRNPVSGGDFRVIPKNMYIIDDGEILNPDWSAAPDVVPDVVPTDVIDAGAQDNAENVFSIAVNYAIRQVIGKIKKENTRKTPRAFCKWWDTKRQSLPTEVLASVDAAGRVLAHVRAVEPAVVLQPINDQIEALMDDVETCLATNNDETLPGDLHFVLDEWTDKNFLEGVI